MTRLICAAIAATAAVAAAARARMRGVSGQEPSRVFTASVAPNGDCVVVPGYDTAGLITAEYTDSVNTTGWGLLNVYEAGGGADSLTLAFAAGCAEAAATTAEIKAYWSNYAAAEYGAAGPSSNLTDFMTAQKAWIRGNLASRRQDADPLWSGIAAVMAQYDGLVAYFAQFVNAQNPSLAMSELDLYMLNSVGDLEELNGIFPNTSPSTGKAFVGATQRARATMHAARTGTTTTGGRVGYDPMPLKDKLTDCSALISILPDGSDVVLGHTTWRSYYAMLRVYKVYALPSVMPAAPVVSFSSSPGLLHSKDDFYSTPALVVMETTNSIYNTTLFDLYITPESAFTWQRVYAANGWTTNGADWVSLFIQYNSGTYNNQWMVASHSLFTPGAAPEPGFLWIVEQIPGFCHAQDVTSVLNAQGHWASYNIPYEVDIWTMSGYPAMADKYGAQYTYDNCSRANIFRRNASDVTDLGSLRDVLRYNDFENDPLALGDPILGSVSSRGDLRTPKAVAFGGVDTKVIALSSMGKGGDLAVLAESGPTHDQQPVFAWVDFPSFETIQRDLVPAVFDFDTITIAVA